MRRRKRLMTDLGISEMSNYTDRELLELAAEAAGIDCEWNENFGKSGMMMLRNPPTYRLCFDPINDDGDALRLAGKFDMILTFSMGGFARACGSSGISDVEYDGDKQKSMRRAIVLCAASIQEKRQEQE